MLVIFAPKIHKNIKLLKGATSNEQLNPSSVHKCEVCIVPVHVESISALPSYNSLTGMPPACCQDLELQLADEELEEMIRDADRSGRGESITEEEYLHILKNSTWI